MGVAYGDFVWYNKCIGGPNAWCNKHVLSWWDVTGCNSFVSWILMIEKTRKKTFILFNVYLIFQRVRTSEK